MENLIFLLSESWSTAAADQFFSMLAYPVEMTARSFDSITYPVEATARLFTLATYPTETDVPLRFGEGGSMASMFWSMLRFVGATLLVALLAWFATKKLFGGARGGFRRGGENLSVIESVGLVGQATLHLVKAGEKYFVVSATKERVTFLAEVDKDDIAELENVAPTPMNSPFGKVFSRFIKPKDGNEDDDGK